MRAIGPLRGPEATLPANSTHADYDAALPGWIRGRDLLAGEDAVKADAGCRNTVFNALAQTGAEAVARLLAAGARHFRLEFLNEGPDLMAATIAQYRQLLDSGIGGAQVWRELRLLNQLGVTSGS